MIGVALLASRQSHDASASPALSKRKALLQRLPVYLQACERLQHPASIQAATPDTATISSAATTLSSESACVQRVQLCWLGVQQSASEGLRWRLRVGQSLQRWMELRQIHHSMESHSDRLAVLADAVSHTPEWVREHLYWAEACHVHPSLVRLPEVMERGCSVAWETLAWCLRQNRLLLRLAVEIPSLAAAAVSEVRRAELDEHNDSRVQE